MTQNCRGRYCGPRDAGTGTAQAHEKREAVRRRRREGNTEEEENDDSGLLGGLFVRMRDGPSDDGDG